MSFMYLAYIGLLVQIIFIYVEQQKKYVPAVALKGTASLFFVVLGFLGLSIATLPTFAKVVVAGLVFGLIGDVCLNLRFVLEKAGQKICVLGKVVPMDEPDCLKENPEATEAAVIQQLANDVIREDEPAIADMVKAAVPRFDNVNHPSHYTQGAVECIDALKASMTKEEFIGYLKGCQMKYVWRYRMKGGVEDLRKARWYLDRLISEVEKV